MSRTRYLFRGWIGSGRCSGCGNAVDSGLALWEEQAWRPNRLGSAGRYEQVLQIFACIPCSHSLANLKEGAAFLTAPVED